MFPLYAHRPPAFLSLHSCPSYLHIVSPLSAKCFHNPPAPLHDPLIASNTRPPPPHSCFPSFLTATTASPPPSTPGRKAKVERYKY
ncbi:hypothetical protein E2C01_069795 [Portunus trituberculatus]|uniref:Uncharacterized protein n=1 Tax=Portunus trituberculatus TaxID=210409 RepID=A0A5B7I3A6_PORTR|nr:hypothetical protein [Portunus trituberculatus]